MKPSQACKPQTALSTWQCGASPVLTPTMVGFAQRLTGLGFPGMGSLALGALCVVADATAVVHAWLPGARGLHAGRYAPSLSRQLALMLQHLPPNQRTLTLGMPRLPI